MTKLHTKETKWMQIIFVVSLIATLGSLYYGYYGDPIEQFATGDFFNPDNAFTICKLCWYARILIYPITLLSGVALIRKERNIAVYILLLAAMAFPLEIYHYTLQKFNISTSEICTFGNPCNALSVNYFDFITIPFLAGIASLIIIIACIMIISKKHI